MSLFLLTAFGMETIGEDPSVYGTYSNALDAKCFKKFSNNLGFAALVESLRSPAVNNAWKRYRDRLVREGSLQNRLSLWNLFISGDEHVEQSLCELDDSVFGAVRDIYDDWSNVYHPLVLDICIALADLELPPYVILEIVDWLPYVIFVRQVRKISLIENVMRSTRRLREARPVNEKHRT